MSGIVPFLDPSQPSDLCKNPWKYAVCGAWDEALDAGQVDPDTGVRNSIMEAFTEHNPQTCLLPDDIESLYMVYPMCNGRDQFVDTAEKWNCHKSDLNIGWVRVLVYVFVPVVLMFTGLVLMLSILKHHEEKKQAKMEAAIVSTQAQAKEAKKEAKKQERKASVMAEALEEQVRTEDERVELRAQQLAAEKIQAIKRKNDAQKAAQAELEVKREENRKLNRDMSFTANYDPKVPTKQASIKKKRSTSTPIPEAGRASSGRSSAGRV